MTGWAVVDVETTGLHPARDRIVEIAIVRLDADGMPEDEWSTIVNPDGRHPGRIHGIASGELDDAPTFRQLLNEIMWRMAGRVVVAHNAPFDVSFLQAETVRSGVAWGPIEGFCTMEVLHDLGLAASRKLHVCCAELGVATGKEHVALDDARAVAGLIGYLSPHLWEIDLPPPAPTWPPPMERVAVAQRRVPSNRVERESRTHLARHAHVPPGLGITEAAGSTYLGLLDLIVEDGQVTESEVEALTLYSHACGITRDAARQLNRAYLGEMAQLARADGVVTDAERAHLDELMVLLSRALPR